MSRKRDTTAWIVTIIALILLVVSIIIIINQGIPALENVAVQVSVVPGTFVPTRAAAVPTTVSSPQAAGGLVNAPPALRAAAQSSDSSVTPNPLALATSTPIACASPISGSDRNLFDAGNNALENANSHQFNFDLTFALDAGVQGNGSLTLSGNGFLQNRPDGGIEIQADTSNAIVYPPGAGQQNIVAKFSVPFRFDMKNIYFRISIPARAIDSPWFAISFEDMLNEATGGSFTTMLPIAISGNATPEGAFMGLDIKALEGSTGFFDLFQLSRFICTQRLANNGEQAHFTNSIDVASFLESSEFANAVDSVVTMSGGTGAGSGAALTSTMPLLLSQYISKLQVNIDHYMNTSDRTLASVTLNMNIGFNIPDASGAMLPMNFRLTGTINYSSYNQAYTLDIPPNPTQLKRIEDVSTYVTGK